MNILKRVALSIAMVSAFAAVSAPAFAEEHKDKNAATRAAADGTGLKIQEAVAIAEKGGNKAEFIAAISEARQLQKEFRYEQTERLRQKLNDRLRTARETADENLAQAGNSAKEALAILAEMKEIYGAAHK